MSCWHRMLDLFRIPMAPWRHHGGTMASPWGLRRCPWLHGVWPRAPPASRSSEAATWQRSLWNKILGKDKHKVEKTTRMYQDYQVYHGISIRYVSVFCFCKIPQFDITQKLRGTTQVSTHWCKCEHVASCPLAALAPRRSLRLLGLCFGDRL